MMNIIEGLNKISLQFPAKSELIGPFEVFSGLLQICFGLFMIYGFVDAILMGSLIYLIIILIFTLFFVFPSIRNFLVVVLGEEIIEISEERIRITYRYKFLNKGKTISKKRIRAIKLIDLSKSVFQAGYALSGSSQIKIQISYWPFRKLFFGRDLDAQSAQVVFDHLQTFGYQVENFLISELN